MRVLIGSAALLLQRCHTVTKLCPAISLRPASTYSGDTGAVSSALLSAVSQGKLSVDRDQLRAASVLDKLLIIASARNASVTCGLERSDGEYPTSTTQTNDGVGKETQLGMLYGSQSGVAGSDGGDSKERSPREAAARPRAPLSGVYLWGNVGTGKTMLMDMFAGALSEAGVPVVRLHFHNFMLAVHAKLHAFHQAIPLVTVETPKGQLVHRHAVTPDEDPIEAVADVLRLTPTGQPAQFLCFDELHVADVADAMILSRLFSRLMASGTMVAFTSNQPPSALYEGGLARDFFLPFVDLITTQAVVLPFKSDTDYRTQSGSNESKGATTGVWLFGTRAEKQEEVLWGLECAAATSVSTHVPLSLPFGRSLFVPEVANTEGMASAARFTFEQLCGAHVAFHIPWTPGGALGPNDFTALAEAFPVVHVVAIPAFTPKDRDAVRRWVVALDCLYEAGARLAGTDIAATFSGMVEASEAALRRAETGETRRHSRRVPPDSAEEFEDEPMGLVREQLLMYRRAQSRLVGMCEETRL